MAARLTPLSKFLITAVVLGGIGTLVYKNKDKLAGLAPEADKPKSNVPPIATLPEDPGPAVGDGAAGCADKPEVRFYHWAWNAQMGLMLATGGKQATEGSLMCKHGVNLKLDPRGQHRPDAGAAGRRSPSGSRRAKRNPTDGAHFVAIMGDGSAAFLKGLNDRLREARPGLHRRGRRLGRLQPRRGQVHGPARVEGEPADGARRPGGGRAARRRLEHRAQVARRQQDPEQPRRDDLRSRRAQLGQRVRLRRRRAEVRQRLLHRAEERQDRQDQGEALRRRRRHLDARRRHRRREEGRPRVDRLDQGVPLADAERDHRQQEVDEREPRASSKGMLKAIFEAGDTIKTDDEALRRRPRCQRARLQGEGRRPTGTSISTVVTQENDKQGTERRARRIGGQQPRRQRRSCSASRPARPTSFARDVHGLRRRREVAVPGARAQLLSGERRCSTRRYVKELAAPAGPRATSPRQTCPAFTGERR